ncbi:hypothetical protein KSX29_23520, partial [Photobacterium ganghwense]|nr:hypothetical protein [Photobacterium ganghwense]
MERTSSCFLAVFAFCKVLSMLSNNDLLFVAGAVQPADRTKKNLASYEAGFLGSKNQKSNHLHNLSELNLFFAREQVKHAAAQPKIDAEHLREA